VETARKLLEKGTKLHTLKTKRDTSTLRRRRKMEFQGRIKIHVIIFQSLTKI
jgi:hypothetical protein